MGSGASGISLTEKTRVTLSLTLLVTGITGLISGVWWASTVTHRLDSIEEAVRDGVDDRWKGAHMRAWVYSFNEAARVWRLEMEANGLERVPSLQAPNPDEIRGLGR